MFEDNLLEFLKRAEIFKFDKNSPWILYFLNFYLSFLVKSD